MIDVIDQSHIEIGLKIILHSQKLGEVGDDVMLSYENVDFTQPLPDYVKDCVRHNPLLQEQAAWVGKIAVLNEQV